MLFAIEGDEVMVSEINEGIGRETVQKICKNNGKALFVKIDVTNEVSVAKKVEVIRNNYETIDVLFSNAGISGVGQVHSIELETW